jgi:membrane protease YdiL (CAAX protease family)
LAALVAERSALRAYWNKSRAPRYSLIFAIPLFLLYEALAASLAGTPGVQSVRNAADVLLKTPFVMFSGSRGSLIFFATVIAVSIFLIGRDLHKSKERPQPRVFGWMLGESAVLALLLGLVVGTLTQKLLGGLSALSVQDGGAQLARMGVGTKLMLSLGAGLYEELLFRVIIVGGLAFGLRWLTLGLLPSGLIATVLGALIFSAFHYVGEYGEPLQVASFTYRTIAGLVFSALYLLRGFGITAWTHALYDVYVLIL